MPQSLWCCKAIRHSSSSYIARARKEKNLTSYSICNLTLKNAVAVTENYGITSVFPTTKVPTLALWQWLNNKKGKKRWEHNTFIVPELKTTVRTHFGTSSGTTELLHYCRSFDSKPWYPNSIILQHFLSLQKGIAVETLPRPFNSTHSFLFVFHSFPLN